jgi:hypothetical protein
MVTLKIIDLNARDKMFCVTNRQKNGKTKTYYVVDDIVNDYYKTLGIEQLIITN